MVQSGPACYWPALNWHRSDDVDVRADDPSDMPSSVCIFEHICTIVRLWIGSADDADVSGVAGTWTLTDWWCSAMSALSLIKCFQQQYTSHYRRCYHQLSALKLFPMTYQNHTILLSWTIHTVSTTWSSNLLSQNLQPNARHELNIARGTTDPGYWLFNLSYLSK